MNITNDAEKMQIVERLVKDGTIDFNEAIKLLQEPEPQYFYPWWQWQNPIITYDPSFTISDDIKMYGVAIN